MLQIFRDPHYDFIGKRKWAYIVSLAFTLLGVVSLGTRGLRYDIDFTGGTLVQVRFERTPSVATIRDGLRHVGLADSVIQEFGDPHEFIVRLPLTSRSAQDLRGMMTTALASEPSLGSFEVRRVEFVGPQVGKELQWQAIYAVLFAAAGILLYIAIRFDLKGGVAAVIAVFHDVLVCLGAISLTGREFSLPVLAALLTIIGYSVNDTIVAYDRLRENRGKMIAKSKRFAAQMNDAVNQTLSRTVLTSVTVLASAVILFFFAGKVLEDFAFVLCVGAITGTYSTTYVAAALVVDWTERVEGRFARQRSRAIRRA